MKQRKDREQPQGCSPPRQNKTARVARAITDDEVLQMLKRAGAPEKQYDPEGITALAGILNWSQTLRSREKPRSKTIYDDAFAEQKRFKRTLAKLRAYWTDPDRSHFNHPTLAIFIGSHSNGISPFHLDRLAKLDDLERALAECFSFEPLNARNVRRDMTIRILWNSYIEVVGEGNKSRLYPPVRFIAEALELTGWGAVTCDAIEQVLWNRKEKSKSKPPLTTNFAPKKVVRKKADK